MVPQDSCPAAAWRGCAELLPVLGLCADISTGGGQREPVQRKSHPVVAGKTG